jgi:hypothetical protein
MEGVVLIHFSFIHNSEKGDFRILNEHHLVAVYYNHRKSNLLRIQFDVTLADLKHQLSQLNGRLHFGDARGVIESIAVLQSDQMELSCSTT